MNFLFLAAVAAAVYAADIATKTIVRSRMMEGAEIPLLPFFSLVHVHNTGVAFGLFQNRNPWLLAVGGGVAAMIVYMAVRLHREDRPSAYCLALVIGGALGNLTDRALRGRVTDFLDFHAFGWHWPAFNIADSAICVGAGLLVWRSFRRGS